VQHVEIATGEVRTCIIFVSISRLAGVFCLLLAGGKSTSQELLKRVRVAYENRLCELRDELGELGDSSYRCRPNCVDKNSTLSEKRLDVLLRQLNNLKTANVCRQ